jgi:UDPglucose 6-dehydrogenase
LCSYDLTCIHECCEFLNSKKYKGIIVIKSTIEPETLDILSKKYNSLSLIHNPEFLTARTAYEDFHNQKHIILGKSKLCSEKSVEIVKNFYTKYYPNAEISICDSIESESVKIFSNSFYAIKVQFFTELYLLTKKNGSNYENIVNLMLKNNWINPMHTIVPGPDGNISYGGLCFPKDTNAVT